MRRYLVLIVFCFAMSLMSTASAERSVATESEIILEDYGFDAIGLLTEVGTPVEVWIDSVGNSTESHAIDVYILTWDSWFSQHECLNEANYETEDDDNFKPMYTKEGLGEDDLPFHFTWTPEIEDDYYLILDNCDNNRVSDYWLDTDQVVVKFAVDDQTDELAEGILAIFGGLGLLCCGGPVCLVILIVVIVVVSSKKKNAQQMVVAPQQMVVAPQQAMPMVQPAHQPLTQPAYQPAYQPPTQPPTQQPAYQPPGGQPPIGGQGGF